jgi:hypothetical protein
MSNGLKEEYSMVNDGGEFSILVSDNSAPFTTERLRGNNFRPYCLAVIIRAGNRPGDWKSDWRGVVGAMGVVF